MRTNIKLREKQASHPVTLLSPSFHVGIQLYLGLVGVDLVMLLVLVLTLFMPGLEAMCVPSVFHVSVYTRIHTYTRPRRAVGSLQAVFGIHPLGYLGVLSISISIPVLHRWRRLRLVFAAFPRS